MNRNCIKQANARTIVWERRKQRLPEFVLTSPTMCSVLDTHSKIKNPPATVKADTQALGR